MALDLDFLTQIINVHWGGGTVFIYGEYLNNKLHFVQFSGPDDDKPEKQTISLPEHEWSDDPLNDQFGVISSSYARVGVKPDAKGTATFLVSGVRRHRHENDGVPATDTHVLIYISHDGLTWTEAHHDAAIISDNMIHEDMNVLGLVWQPGEEKFYFSRHHAGFNFETNVGFGLDEAYRSSTGVAWGQVYSRETSGDESYNSSAPFPEFCAHHDRCKDEFGNPVPDGVGYFDAEQDSSAFPVKPPVFNYAAGTVVWSPGTNKVHIRRVEQDEAGNDKLVEFDRAIPGIENITCVAGGNDILMAGGFVAVGDTESAGAVALSTDGGETWKLFDSTSRGVVTMIAAPASDA